MKKTISPTPMTPAPVQQAAPTNAPQPTRLPQRPNVLALHRTLGNQAVGRLLAQRKVQAKRGVGATGAGPTPLTTLRGVPTLQRETDEERAAREKAERKAAEVAKIDRYLELDLPKPTDDEFLTLDEDVITPVTRTDPRSKAELMAEVEEKKAMDEKPVPRQQVSDLGYLYAHAKILKAHYKHLVEEVATGDGRKGTVQHRPGPAIKTVARAHDKIMKDYGGDASRIVDLAGSSIFYDNVDDLIAGFKQLQKTKGITIARVKNTLAKAAGASGYGDINMVVVVGDGMHFELQLHLAPIIHLKEHGGHDIYEKQQAIERGGDATDKAEKLAAVKKEMADFYAPAWQKVAGKSAKSDGRWAKLKKKFTTRSVVADAGLSAMADPSATTEGDALAETLAALKERLSQEIPEMAYQYTPST